jgi:hypothetical protein
MTTTNETGSLDIRRGADGSFSIYADVPLPQLSDLMFTAGHFNVTGLHLEYPGRGKLYRLSGPVPTETVAYFVGPCDNAGVRILVNGKPVGPEDLEAEGGLH